MKQITLDTDNYQLPANWNELTTEQLVFLLSLVNRKTSIQEIKTKIFLFCLQAHIGSKHLSHTFTMVIGKRKYPVSAGQLTALSDSFDYLFSHPDENGNYSLEPKLTRNPFPTTKCGCITVCGPDDGLTNITYDQFIMLQTYQQRIATHPSAIDELISIIYKRNIFKPESPGEPAIIKQMSPTVKTAILWFYLGTLQFLSGKFPRVFSGGGEPSGTSAFESQMKILDTLAEGDVTKKNTVRNSLLYDALFTMEFAIERQEKMK
ncbi:MAG: hypothetical protein LBJ72_11875 [Dysgonamonadaceae bacterium]|jgi:hypothetical protein|nr:hypothetical protein [Dysgonamonadaceae bacterium]